MKMTRLKSKEPDIHSKRNTQKQEKQKLNRQAFFIQTSCIRVLARQGLALRGHLEEKGNLYQLMKAQVENDKIINK